MAVKLVQKCEQCGEETIGTIAIQGATYFLGADGGNQRAVPVQPGAFRQRAITIVSVQSRRSPMTQRVVVFAWLACMASGCGTPVRADVFGPLNRALTSVQSAIGVGVAYAPFGELIRALATETELARQQARTAEERAIVESVDSALAAYKDSLAAWSMKIEKGPNLNPFLNPDVEALAAKYSIEKNQVGNYRADDILQAAWRVAEGHAKAAADAYTQATVE